MPARLADGLGLESGLGAAYTAPFAPPRNCSEEFGSPAPSLWKEGGLRLLQKRTKGWGATLEEGASTKPYRPLS
jgi:hypothetical protein